MGRSIDNMDIHSPSVPEPTLSSTAQSLNELLEEKIILEGTLSQLDTILVTHGVDMSTPLIDHDGYPRADLDIAQIRTVRAQVIRLKNDHKDLMSRIEKGLHTLHQENRQSEEQKAAESPPPPPNTVVPQLIPFAIVNSVAASSPAAEAGLEKDDKIMKFGTCYAHNNAKLVRLAEVVQNSQGRVIDVVILRGEERIGLKLTPRTDWGGRGSLGCHLLPL